MFEFLTERPAPLKKGEPHGRALLLIMRGKGLVLTWDGDEGVHEWISDCRSGSDNTFRADGVLDYDTKLADGIYIGELGWQNEGPSDWPDAGNEYSLAFGKERVATDDEWQDFLNGDYPWEPMHEAPTS